MANFLVLTNHKTLDWRTGENLMFLARIYLVMIFSPRAPAVLRIPRLSIYVGPAFHVRIS